MNRQDLDMREIDMAASLEGRLAGPARDAFDRLLNEDPEEQHILELTRGFVQAPEETTDPPDRLVQRVREFYPRRPDVFDLVLSLVRNALTVIRASANITVVAPAAAAGAVRSAEAGAFPMVMLTKNFSRARADVYIESLPGSTCTFHVRAMDLRGGAPLRSARAELVSGQRELASSPLEKGMALFEEVRPGQYEIIIRKDAVAVGTMSVKIIGE